MVLRYFYRNSWALMIIGEKTWNYKLNKSLVSQIVLITEVEKLFQIYHKIILIMRCRYILTCCGLGTLRVPRPVTAFIWT